MNASKINMNERIPTNYAKIEDLQTITAEDLFSIELMAKTLSMSDCLDALFLTEDDLTPREINIVTRVHARGRQLGVQKAGDNLFMLMKQRNGTLAALEYLKQMSSTFTLEIAPEAKSGGFSFNVFPAESAPKAPAQKVTPIKEMN